MTKPTTENTTNTKQPLEDAIPKEQHVNIPMTEPLIPSISYTQTKATANHWYGVSIFATLCCCLPCGVVGLVHAMFAQQESDRGNLAGAKERLRKTKCWTGWSIGLGTVMLLLVLAYIGAVVYFTMRELHYDFKGGQLIDDGGIIAPTTAKLIYN